MHMKARLIAGIAKALLCVLLLSAATYAWFASERSKTAAGQTIDIAGSGMKIQGYAAYQDGQRIRYEDDVFNMEPFDMVSYDSIFDERNEQAPLLLRVRLEGAPPSARNLNITFTCTESDINANRTSNIIKFCYATEAMINTYYGSESVTEAGIVNGDAATVAAQVKLVNSFLTSDDNSANQKRFVNSASNTKVTVMNVQVPLTAAEVSNELCNFYLLFDYDPQLINKFVNVSMTDTSHGATTRIYSSDLGVISFTYGA